MAKEKEEVVRNDSEKIDKIVSFIVMKRLITPIKKSDAFKLGLIDRSGKIIKQPTTDEEKNSLSELDKLIFKLKNLMGSRLAQLNTFMYLQSSQADFSNSIIVTGGIEKRGIVKRVLDDLNSLFEKYDITQEEFFNGVLNEEIIKKGM